MMRSSRRYLRIREVTITSSDNQPACPRSITKLAVKSCSKAVIPLGIRHGKSPCFSRCRVFALVDVDYPSVDFAVVDVEEILE